MGKQYRIIRKIATVNIVAGGFDTRDLPRDYDYEAIGFRISGSLQVSVANATSVRAEAPCQLVPRVEIIADGKNNLCSVPFWALSLGRLDTDIPVSGARGTTPPSSPNIATYAVEAIGMYDFATVDGVRPKDSNFRSRGLSLFQVRFTFGNAVDCFVQGGATVAFSGTPTVDIYAMQCVEEQDANGNFLTTPIALKKMSYQQLAQASTNANQELRLPAGNMIRGVLLRTEGVTTALEPQTGALNNAILQNGVDVRVNLQAANIRAFNNARYGQITPGYYNLDLVSARGGYGNLTLSDLWDLTGPSEPKLVMDLTAGTAVVVYAVTTEYILANPR